ncbi:MAG: hypothetical protein AABY33_08510 [Pseudomonadota bacterium]
MSDNIENLFKIVGEEEPEFQRVKEAMEWLISPKAAGIGQKLLRDAYALRGKPLTIEVSKEAQTAYLDLNGEHTIRINPHNAEKTTILDNNGKSVQMSVERALAHEMKHSGQDGLQEATNNKTILEDKISNFYKPNFTPEQKSAISEDMARAMESPDYETARQHLAKYVDQFAVPKQKAVSRELFAHPEYIEYVKKFEMPAVEVENQIAVLRGEPARITYLSSYNIKPEDRRDMILDELSETMELNKKPHLSAVVQDAKGASRK